MRKAYLDNIRWSVILLVLVYHVCYLFNGLGIPGGIPGAQSIAAFDALACAVYPWFMVLLFVVAGMCARYSLQKRTGRQFIRQRATKLLVPATLGLFVIHWVTGYLNIKMGGGLPYIPPFLVYPISAISGIGPLWFAQTLFVFSCVLVLLRKADREDRVWKWCEKANTAVVLLLFLPVWGAAQVLNAPVLTMYRFGIYLAAFLIGYYIFSHERVQNALEKICLPLLAAAVAGAAAYTAYYYGSDYTSPQCLQSLFTNLYLWVVVLAVIGCAKKYGDRTGALAGYLTRNCFGLYILHYPVLTLTCYILQYHTALSAGWKYLLALVSVFTVTFLLNETVKRIPILRFWVLGQRR